MPDRETRGAARLATLVALPLAVVAGLASVWALGGFGSPSPAPSASPQAQPTTPVTMAAPALTNQQADICRAFVAQLPDALRDMPRRPVTAGPKQNAAYGNPPVTVACGPRPVPSYPLDAVLPFLSGVCWYNDHSRPDVTVWTTLDRQVPITVTMPASIQSQADWMQEFTNPIVASVPPSDDEPTGCKG